ncbi:hypothetical protein [Chryseolinea sp. H1M3-3]|uniref:hypothetical protein n=1 Tax=Chryseolinea sp. H1M3-3 TaxID=3034144 RepID=UPI0023EBF14D|nr:hypothetical protein [Chryseolinea sp. H1M3-3]
MTSPTNQDSGSEHDEKTVNRKRNLKPILVKIGLDMIPVIGGILIALFINSLQENRRDQQLLASTLASLSDEFSKNKESIEKILPRQQLFLDSLRFFSENESYSIADIGTKTKGIVLSELHSTNWRTSLNNNSLRLLNFEAINLLSRIDAKREELKDQEAFINPTVFGPPFFKKGKEGMEYRKGMELWMAGLIGNETELLELYREFEELLQNKRYQR